ncbi:MAG: flagellar hook-length control protein FliK, partial [Planctomycetota bacterium]
YLEQAARTFQTTADTHRPTTPDTARRDADDRSRDAGGPPAPASSEAPSRRADPGSRENEPAAASRTPSDADPQTSVSQADQEPAASDADQGTDVSDADKEADVSDADKEASVSDAESSSDAEEENNDEESIANATQAVQLVNVDPSDHSSTQQGPDGNSLVPDEDAAVRDGKQDAAQDSKRKEAPAPAGKLSEGKPEGADQPGDTAEIEESTSTPESEGREARRVREEEDTPDESVRQPQRTTGQGDGSEDEGKSDESATVRVESTGESALTQDSAGNARRRNGRQGENRTHSTGISDNPPADNPRQPETAQVRQNLGIGLPAETAGDAKSDAAASAPSSSPSGVSQIETAASTRPQPGQGPREPSTAPARETPGPDQVDRARFVGRVARAFEAIGDRSGSVRLRLHPPELGSLRLEVSVRNGTMTARLEVETNTARTALLDNLPALRDRLAEQNIKVGRFDVDLSDRSFSGSPQQPGDHPHSQHRPQENRPYAGAEPEVERAGALPLKATSQPGQGSQLDVVI